MKENFPSQNENNEDERLLKDAEYVINSMWEKTTEIDDLPLDVDLSYQAWRESLENHKSDFARVLFKRARETTGEDKFRSARTLKRLMKLFDNVERQNLLSELMTTEEAVQELIRQAEEQIRPKQTKSERIKSKFRKTVDRLLLRDDDFDDNLK